MVERFKQCVLRPLAVLAAALAAGAAPAAAEVLDAAASGFTIRHSVTLAASRDVVWRTLVNDIGLWWNDDHTVSGDAANLYISPVPLGCFCERLGDGGGLVHLTVTFVNPGVLLRLSGGLGPLGLMGANGNMTFEFDDVPGADDRSSITLRYAVGGYLPDGLDAMAGSVDEVLGEQLERLAAYIAAGAAP